MSVLIKGMEMPKNCDECKLFRMHRVLGEPILCCEANDRELDLTEEYERGEKRLSDCPLVEVPAPHGRLIDKDALIARMEADAEHIEEPIASMFAYAAISDVKHAPTIIEAEEGEDE